MPIETLGNLVEASTGFRLEDVSPLRAQAAAHFGASFEREFAMWNTSAGSADADLLPEIGTLRERSRDLARNQNLAAGALQTVTDNVVGCGLRLSARPDYRALGKTKDWAMEWSAIVESAWRSWAETTDCDAAGTMKFSALTTQIFRGALANGEGLALPLWLPDRGKFATRLQVIEADRLSNPNSRLDTDRLRGGIEIDEFGTPLAFWIAKTHPGDRYLTWNWNASHERVPAKTAWGRARVLHVHDRERSGQNRGKPYLAPVIGALRMYDHYQRTELQAAVVNAMVAAFVETPLDPLQLAQSLGADPSDEAFVNWMTKMREYTAPLKGAAILPVMPGSKISPFMPSRPAAAFEPFLQTLARNIGAGLNLPYELVLKDFSKTNYSSARAALLEAWRFFLGRRAWLSDYWLTPVYYLWLEEAVSLGIVDAPGFYENRYAYQCCRWIGGPRGWVDPVKEVEASGRRMQLNVSTLEDECAEQGKDWEEVLEQRAREQQRMRDLGIIQTVPPAAPLPASDEPDDDEEDTEDAQ